MWRGPKIRMGGKAKGRQRDKRKYPTIHGMGAEGGRGLVAEGGGGGAGHG